jgi:hypothetical protein
MGDRLSGVEIQDGRPSPVGVAFPSDNGAPRPDASGDLSISVVLPLPGRGLIRSGDECPPEGRDPAIFFSVQHMGPMGFETKRIPWKEGIRLRHYLREAKLLAKRMRCRLVNGSGQKIRLAYVPKAGETIKLLPPGAPIR